jgi:hypothetical protein
VRVASRAHRQGQQDFANSEGEVVRVASRAQRQGQQDFANSRTFRREQRLGPLRRSLPLERMRGWLGATPGGNLATACP